jgi:5-methylcytosine-specific restriction protein A
VCPTPGCPALTPGGRCATCKAKAEKARGTSAQRGYGRRHQDRFRKGVLARHPVCVICRQQPSTVADHWPLDRRQLVAKSLDPDDPVHGRGLCASCDSAQTAHRQPGGWHTQ